ncbi:MAG: cation acetate symporter [Clostridia bacterium]|nr:cation acetate symporter [Clostridia bacterium]
MYVVGFASFVILMAILNANGVPDRIIGYFFLGWTISIFAAVGILSRTGQLTQYYVAGREVPGVYNGMATASDWMSAASFIGMAGTIMILGFDGLPFIMGWTGGYVLLALLIGPYLRKLGAFTIPDFVSSRYGYGENKHVIRIIALIITIVIGFVYIVPQIAGVGLITSRFLGIPFVIGCFVGLLGVLVCSMLGGMRAVTWTQVAQYIVLIIAYLIPVSVLSFQYTGNPIPYLAYGQVIQKIIAEEQTLFNSPEEISAREAFAAAGQPARAKEPQPYTAPFVRMDLKNFLILTFCLMLGTTGLPHILMRYYTLPSVREARKSVLWTLFFISLLYLAAPAYSANALLTIYTQLVGTPMVDLPSWVTTWSQVGLITITDINGDGLVQFAEIAIKPDMVVLATPEMAGLPYVIAGLIASGGLAAALSTADGLLLTISNAFAHDLYYKVINPKASANTRLALARTLLVIAAVIAGFVASQNIAIIVELVAWAFSIAASTFFPVLVMGIFWKRATKEGGIAGLTIGLGVCLFYMIGSRFYGLDWFGIRTIGSGIFGIPAAFLSIYVVSLLTPAPPKAVTDLMETLRYPKGSPRGSEEGLDT